MGPKNKKGVAVAAAAIESDKNEQEDNEDEESEDKPKRKGKGILKRMEKGSVPTYERTVGRPGYMSAQEFVRTFERECFGQRVPMEEKAYHMQRFLDDPSKDWVMDNLAEVMDEWDAFKEAFLEHFEDKNADDRLRHSLFEMRTGPKETVMDYTSRYLRLVRQVNAFDPSISEDNGTLVVMFIKSLPPRLEEEMHRLRRARPEGFNTLKLAVDECEDLARDMALNEPAGAKNISASTGGGANKRGPDKPVASGTGSDDTSAVGGGAGGGSRNCHFCDKLGHRKADCWFNPESPKYKGGANPSTGASTGAGKYEFVPTCKYCKKTGHIRPKCTAWHLLPRAERDVIIAKEKAAQPAAVKLNRVQVSLEAPVPAANMTMIVDGGVMGKVGNDRGVEQNMKVATETAVVTEKKVEHDQDQSIRVTAVLVYEGKNIVINNALVDTGATHALLSRGALPLLNIAMTAVQPGAGFIQLGENGAVVPRLGITPPIEVRYGKRRFFHRFEVMDLPDGEMLFVGENIRAAMGIAIVGLTSAMPEYEEQEVADIAAVATYVDEHVVRKASKELQPDMNGVAEDNQREDEMPTVVDEGDPDEVAAVLAGIDVQLKANEALDPKGHCTHPMAMIYLETGDAEPIFIKQYRMPHSMDGMADEEIQKDIRDAVLKPFYGTSEWNFPYICVAVRDETGKIISVRVCVDVRRLNNILKNMDCYPLPDIEELFERLAGYKRYCVVDIKSFFKQFPMFSGHFHN